jgi:hypothetical protein
MFLVVYIFNKFQAKTTNAVAYPGHSAVGLLFFGGNCAFRLQSKVYQTVA